MFTDLVGYSSMASLDEAQALRLLEEYRNLLRNVFEKFGGRVVKTMGDGFLVEFASAVEAVNCAVQAQTQMRQFNEGRGKNEKVFVRIGIHVGDIIHSNGDILGDAVNVAARLQSLAEAGGICLTRQVVDQIERKVDYKLVKLETHDLKNIKHPVELYKMEVPTGLLHPEEPAPDPRRIAILPFVNLSPDPNDSYFADGLTEEIISTLSGVSGLSVISRTSIMGYKATTKKVREIGAELDAGSVLEGSLRKAGNKIRVTTQLIAVSNDRHVWAQSYDRNLDDVFAVQSDIAKHVADALRIKILADEIDRIEKKPTENTTAYTLYLKGRYFWNKRGLEEIKKAAEYFEEAIREDANFALGYVGLADCHEILTSNFGLDIHGNHEKAIGEVAKAMKLDSGLAEAHATRGLVLVDEYKLSQAEEEFKKAIELKPSYAPAYLWYSHLLRIRMRWEEALKLIQKAVELDPFSQVINMNHSYLYFARRDYQRALELALKATELNLNSPTAHFDLVEIYGRLKLFDDLRRELKIVVGLLQGEYPYVSRTAAAITAYFERDDETLRRLLPELEARVGEPWTAGTIDIAGACFRLGDNDAGFKWLEKSYARREFQLLYLGLNDSFDGIRGDPRYQALLKRLELNDTEIS